MSVPKRVLGGVVGLIVVAVAIVAMVLWPKGTTEVDEEQALDEFRSRTSTTLASSEEGTTGGNPTDGSSPTTKVPADGVYTYVASGQEEVKLGPLPTETRRMPESVTASLSSTATSGASETVAIGDTEVEGTPISIVYEVSGDLSGSWSETLWLGPDLLPLRIERTLRLNGPATFTEASQRVLRSLVPTV